MSYRQEAAARLPTYPLVHVPSTTQRHCRAFRTASSAFMYDCFDAVLGVQWTTALSLILLRSLLRTHALKEDLTVRENSAIEPTVRNVTHPDLLQ
ncbi:Ribonuclease 3 [Trichinella spiralis]|uniref:Ribonuclease 3 n=2 Tax=Trichinella spiralis TaxID=6334 RepID=A0ABR3KII0_TRISP|nr:putative sulfur relay protein TusB [Trichinella spiralis]KRY35668.1 hypothetical protein T01_871 [Trichinella spiralis]